MHNALYHSALGPRGVCQVFIDAFIATNHEIFGGPSLPGTSVRPACRRRARQPETCRTKPSSEFTGTGLFRFLPGFREAKRTARFCFSPGPGDRDLFRELPSVLRVETPLAAQGPAPRVDQQAGSPAEGSNPAFRCKVDGVCYVPGKCSRRGTPGGQSGKAIRSRRSSGKRPRAFCPPLPGKNGPVERQGRMGFEELVRENKCTFPVCRCAGHDMIMNQPAKS